jgi:hypothetical protein
MWPFEQQPHQLVDLHQHLQLLLMKFGILTEVSWQQNDTWKTA